MFRLKSDSRFFDFFTKGGSSLRMGVIILLGVILLLLGSGVGREVKEESQSTEERTAEMCAMMDGVGECRVMMTYYPESDRVYAVLVLCDGAESATVRERITSSLCSLYGIGANRVEIQRLNR